MTDFLHVTQGIAIAEVASDPNIHATQALTVAELRVARIRATQALTVVEVRMARLRATQALVVVEVRQTPHVGGGEGGSTTGTTGQQSGAGAPSGTTVGQPSAGAAAPSGAQQPGAGATPGTAGTQPSGGAPTAPSGTAPSGGAPSPTTGAQPTAAAPGAQTTSTPTGATSAPGTGAESGARATPGATQGAIAAQVSTAAASARNVSRAAARAGNALFAALAASRASVGAGTVFAPAGAPAGGGSVTKRAIVSTVWVDWDRNGSYTEETAYFISARGTSSLTAPEQMLAGGRGAVASCQVVLSNQTRRFSPSNSSGALYADIAAGGAYMAPVQVKVSVDSVLHVLFTGYIREMTESAPTPGKTGTVTLECRAKDDKLLQDKQSTPLADFLADSATGHTEDFHIINLLELGGMTDGVDFISHAHSDELTTNGGFTDDIASWAGANWAWEAGADGQARHSAGATAALTQNVTVIANAPYRVTVTIADRSAGTLTVTLGSATLAVSGVTAHTATASGVVWSTGAGSVALSMTPTTDFDGAVTSVTVDLSPSIDTGIFPVQYVWLDDESVLDEMWGLVAACCGWFYCDAGGFFHYHNITGVLPESLERQYGSIATIELDESQVSGLQLKWPTGELYSEIMVEISPRAPGEAGEIWAPDDPIVIQPNQTKTVWARLDAAQTITPIRTEQAYTSGGAEINADYTIAQTDYAQRVKFVIENTGTRAAYFNTLNLEGQTLDGGRTLEVEAISAEAFWTDRPTRRRSVRNNVYIQGEAQAETIAAYTLRRQELPVLMATIPNVDRADVRIGWPVSVEFGTVVPAADTFTGLVSNIQWRLDNSGYHQDITVLETGSLFAGVDPFFILGTHKLGAVADPDEAYLFY